MNPCNVRVEMRPISAHFVYGIRFLIDEVSSKGIAVKKLIAAGLFLNVALLAGRFWQELPMASGGTTPAAFENGDVNGDGLIDISDAVYLLIHMFSDGPAPVAVAQSESLNEDEVSLLRELLENVSIEQLPIDETGNTADTIRFTGVNIQIVNGLGATNGNPEDPHDIFQNPGEPDFTSVNGTGNLIVGYQEFRIPGDGIPNQRSGSHNLVVGQGHNYTSYGGTVTGSSNQVSGTYSSVTGGWHNHASGHYSSVSGGSANRANVLYSTVSGGWQNHASGKYSSVSGGSENRASAMYSTVSGGESIENSQRASHLP